jgi:CDP-diacylglycerol---glycerol-3-phosphate 3-phosphatidyltransferase
VSSSFVSPELRARVRGMAEPVGRALARTGLTPNALTLTGFGIACVAAVAAAAQLWVLAGFLVIFGGVFDMFDGMVARATGKASRIGAFMDSTFDRWGEGAVYIGIVAGCLFAGHDAGAVLAAAAMTAAFMVSYTRARAESLGFAPPSGMASVGLAPREVRLVILAAGVVLAGVSLDILAISLGLIVVLATITVVQRIVVTVRQAKEQE